MSTRKFDLNIEKILEDWEVHHAVREIIANALDEQAMSKTRDIEIFKDSLGKWHVRDFGRGLTYLHLTQNENEEKLSNPHVIGKFGIGLKDALATLDRKQAHVLIRSKHGDITLGKEDTISPAAKHSQLRLLVDPMKNEFGYVTVESRGRNSVVHITKEGKNALRVFGTD
jgi:hypothetical protein